MKPSAIANASFWLTIGLIILFSIESYYIGTIALLVCLIFFNNTYAGKVAKIYFIVSMAIILLCVILILVFNVDINMLFKYEFPFIQDQEMEAFKKIIPFA